MCTVKLSRRLFPEHRKHNLDSLIERHGLQVGQRHRALGDARAIAQFWQGPVQAVRNAEVLAAAVKALTARPSIPAHLGGDDLDALPAGPGVYLFYGENDLPLYVGKSKTLKKRILAHFAADHSSSKEMVWRSRCDVSIASRRSARDRRFADRGASGQATATEHESAVAA